MPQSPESVALVRGLLVRLLALVSLIAFVSLWVQVHGLIGENGLLPARDHLERLRPALEGRWWRAPTLLWLGAGDVALNAVCAAGVVAAGLALCGIFQLPALLATWTLYLSLTVVGQDFLSFQWDVLLLEALVVT
ncbi:MAG: hypothetical protein VYE73_02630 [Acidobacteriota bacterium]|nr:hypothetical protein [Acidobacteriota bacterium]